VSRGLLDGRTTAQKIQEAIDLLQENGYVVRGPLLVKDAVKTPAQLVRYFYDMLARYRPESVTIYGGNTVRDRAVAKELIAARMKTGCSKQRAITESCEIIDLLFKYEDRLGLAQTVASMVVLGQSKMGWVTEKLLQIRENLDRSVLQEEDAKFFQQLYNKQEANITQDKIKEAREKMDEVLENYGKKEETNRDD
jgi:hypothetical protein